MYTYMRGRSGKLKAMANERGITVAQLIDQALRDNGSIYRAALALGVTPNSIQFWLQRNQMAVETEVSAKLVPIDHPIDDNVTIPAEPAEETL